VERLLKAIQARKLDRIAAAYALGGWLLVQAASIALPAFAAPAWTLKALILFVVLGFPVALAAGWMGAPHFPSSQQEAAKLKPLHATMLAIVLAVIVLSLGEFVYWMSRSAGTESDVSIAPASASIAVLPFVNMSGDAAKDYFSDGISDELLNDLANVPELRVAARTSSFAFKGKSEDIKTIARLLAVRSVLEGSVREAGQHLRIHAELIDAADGFDLWSASFDRQMTDALAVQDEIARACCPPARRIPTGPRPLIPKPIATIWRRSMRSARARKPVPRRRWRYSSRRWRASPISPRPMPALPAPISTSPSTIPTGRT